VASKECPVEAVRESGTSDCLLRADLERPPPHRSNTRHSRSLTNDSELRIGKTAQEAIPPMRGRRRRRRYGRAGRLSPYRRATGPPPLPSLSSVTRPEMIPRSLRDRTALDAAKAKKSRGTGRAFFYGSGGR